MQNSPLLQQLLIGLVVLTSTGTLVQDTRLGRALEATTPLSDVSINLSSHLDGMNEAASAHTHVEQNLNQDASGITRIQARDDRHRYYTPKTLSRRSTPFGDTSLFEPEA